MKNYQFTIPKALAFVSLFINWRNWFFCLLCPAIPGQKWAVAVMVGTHGRYGLMLGNRWLINGGMKGAPI